MPIMMRPSMVTDRLAVGKKGAMQLKKPCLSSRQLDPSFLINQSK